MVVWESQRAPNKRRKRKGSQSGQNANSNSTGGSKKRSPGPNFSLASQVSDVMVVGEPSLMGGEFGDEDERLITRLENSQYDGTPLEDGGAGGPHGAGPGGPGPGPGGPGSAPGGPPGGPSGPTTFNNSPMSGPWPQDPSRPAGQDADKKSPAISQ
ncbi:uncharacterized protein LOC143023163 isoform X1 [Oratosquilla oratoria]|uniref:uncharacterized protein LOC143023163 isoform X1 n=1 Tax=Oratosquilla oratoria TaxID=337810 RepID=UPI003F757263